MVSVIRNARSVTDGKILDGHVIVLKDNVIDAVLPAENFVIPEGAEVKDLQGNFISAGWIDLHCHGAGGFEFIGGTDEAILTACQIHFDHGTQILYPTISATKHETSWQALEALEKVIDKCPMEIPGVHMEGPYLSKAMCGAQDTQYITKPIREDYLQLMDRFPKLIKRWTYAPEEDENGEFLKELVKRGITPSMGHTNADYQDVMDAFEGGCRLVTHLYSCTSSITRHSGFRHLGVTECAYLLDDMYVETIADGCHLPAPLMQMIVKCKKNDHICLITDAISFAGMENTDALQGGTQSIPYLIEDGVAKLMDRSAFAGSIATTDVLLKRTVAAGVEMPNVIRMMTENPAKAMGLDKKGRIAPGYDAQFCVFDKELNYLGNAK